MDIENLHNINLELESVVESFGAELKNIRTGRANPSLVEDIMVDYFGTKTPLKQTASISSADAKSLVIAPWNTDNLVDIENAIKESDININPTNDGTVIRLNFPPLTEERREELVKHMKKKTEEARIRVRKIREDVWDEIQKKEKAGEISEDDKFRKKEELQKIVDEFNAKIEELSSKKEEEIMTV